VFSECMVRRVSRGQTRRGVAADETEVVTPRRRGGADARSGTRWLSASACLPPVWLSGSEKDGYQVGHCSLTGASSRRGAEVGRYEEQDDGNELELRSIRLESRGEVSWLPWQPVPSIFCWTMPTCLIGSWLVQQHVPCPKGPTGVQVAQPCKAASNAC